MNKAGSELEKDFLFKIPKISGLSFGATIAIQISAIASRQTNIKRTRCNHPDGRPENVAEHSLMLSKVAPELANILYPELDENLVARFATLHDDVEAYVGDTPTDKLSYLNQSLKESLEVKGLHQLSAEYSHIPSYVKLMNDYEVQVIPEARFVRAVDKLMVMLIHFPNEAKTIKENYNFDSFLESEKDLLERDRYKYNEFSKIIELRQELGITLANTFLK